MGVKITDTFFNRWMEQGKELDKMPDPDLPEELTLEDAQAILKVHKALYPKGDWLFARKGHFGYAFERNGEWLWNHNVTQLAGLPVIPFEPLTKEDLAAKDWMLSRNEYWWF